MSKMSIWSKRAKALNRGKLEKVTSEDLQSVIAIWGEECFYCGAALDFSENNGWSTFDHVIPAARGRNTKRNLVPCCALCNREKDEKRVVWDRKRGILTFTWAGTPKISGFNSTIAAARKRNS